MENFVSYLCSKSYPGRGIFVGHIGDVTVSAYFIMGRSENSRNRIFCLEGDTLRTEAFDPSKLADPSLIIYNCTTTVGDLDVITNGDHTDTVVEFLQRDESFESAMRSRRYEPDPPNFTPRIAGIATADESLFGICKGDESGDNPADVRCFFSYGKKDGVGRIIHTYRGEEDGVLLPFNGEPVELSMANEDIDIFTKKLWDALDSSNRVSLFVRYRSATTNETRIVNANS